MILRLSTVVASRCVNVVAGAGSVKSSAGTYTACTDVIDPFFVDVMRSCICTHFGSQCRLITHGRRHTSQQGGHFGTGLGETEDVVDEEQNVTRSVSLIACHGKTRLRSDRKALRKNVRPAVRSSVRIPWPACDFSTSSMSTFDRSQLPGFHAFQKFVAVFDDTGLNHFA